MLIHTDAGHGGEDPGATHKNMKEKDVALAITKKLNNILSYWNDFEVTTTREDDTFYQLKERADMANSDGADLFISIHTNSWNTNDPNGIETYHYPGSIQGKKLATAVHNNLIKNTTHNNRGIKTGNFTVLKQTKVPAILCETGFITNDQDYKALQKDYIRFLKAYSIADGIRRYLNK